MASMTFNNGYQQQHNLVAGSVSISNVVASRAEKEFGKLQRLIELNQRLEAALSMPRIPVSAAARDLVKHCNTVSDPLIPGLWGEPSGSPFTSNSSSSDTVCCIII
ncbi:hypothetical protein DFJ73DRAFT_820049 [Zopfochytrium polystomum]|nr:hypothetical protein DFJ73DRAFT_820049 [Zopfochytrium polystomum]